MRAKFQNCGVKEKWTELKKNIILLKIDEINNHFVTSVINDKLPKLEHLNIYNNNTFEGIDRKFSFRPSNDDEIATKAIGVQ